MKASWDLVDGPNLFVYLTGGCGVESNLKEVFVLAKVALREGESQDKLLRRFRKAVIRSGVMGEVRKRRWFVSKNEQRRMAEKKAARRQRKRDRRSN